MLFTSYSFMIFVAVTFCLYYVCPKKWQWAILLGASYFFYFMAGRTYLIYILVTTVSTYLAARQMDARKERAEQAYALQKDSLDKEGRKALKAKQKKGITRVFLACLILNIGILAVVKYTNFMIANINGIAKAFGGDGTLSFVDLVLPMGISFYTFQSVAYLIDVYHGKYPAQKHLGKFALFVAFFPQLVQGPISRYNELSESLFALHSFDKQNIAYGLERILWGYFKKMVIADRMLVAVKVLIAEPETYYGSFAFVGMLFYALELYADFTGGIDITIGVAQLFGVKVAENFRRPYFSKNIKEYWKRWHISMGTWFTDYIFYPVSVSKPFRKLNKFAREHFGDHVGKRLPVYLSSFVVWLLTGIWHGASWNFIAWGLGNYVVIMISEELEPLYHRFHKRFHVAGTLPWKLFQVIRTVLIMSCLRMFDCYRDVPLTFQMFGSMFARPNLSALTGEAFLGLGLGVTDYIILAAGALVLFAVSMIQRAGSVRTKIASCSFPVRMVIWWGLFFIVLLFGAYSIGYNESQFIYNQF
ncbi:MAG: MBOAT family protein [Lachnospiraceae bacterium]|nr:MBOAT family protein [Lachnospiraceae bacterium]